MKSLLIGGRRAGAPQGARHELEKNEAQQGGGARNSLIVTRRALVDLYRSTQGERWRVNFGWLSLELHQWWGLRMSLPVPAERGVIDSVDPDAGPVLQAIRVMGNNLMGALPSSIGTLTTLEELSLQSNSLRGVIPTTIGNLKHLRRLNLSFCSLTGVIPPSIFNLHQLEELLLRQNYLSGTIPENLGQKLQIIDLADNQLTGSLPPKIGLLKDLIILNVDNNFLSGDLPQSLLNLEGCEISVSGNVGMHVPVEERNEHTFPLHLCPVSVILQMNSLQPFCTMRPSLVIGVMSEAGGELKVSLKPAIDPSEKVERSSRSLPSRSSADASLGKASVDSALIGGGQVGANGERNSLSVLRERNMPNNPKPPSAGGGGGSGSGVENFHPSSRVNREDCAFISHRWASGNHPDNASNSLLAHLKAFILANPDIAYIWLDYLCIPQVICPQRVSAIDSLASYVATCGRFVVPLGDLHFFEMYKRRAWCGLEMLLACLPPMDEREAQKGWTPCSQIVSIYQNGELKTYPLDELAGDSILNPLDGALTFEHDRPKIAHVLLWIIEKLPTNIMSDTEKRAHKMRVITSTRVEGGRLVSLVPQVRGLHASVNALKLSLANARRRIQRKENEHKVSMDFLQEQLPEIHDNPNETIKEEDDAEGGDDPGDSAHGLLLVEEM